MLSIAITQERLEAALTAGELACPACSGRLSPHGFARSREVRLRHEVRSVTPRRAYCGACETTHVLSPAWMVARRRDGAEVIGEALRLAAAGAGHRVIARRLGRPPGTVRGWLRAARARSGLLRASAVQWACALDAGELTRVAPAGSSLGDAVEALAIAVRAWTLRFGNQRAGGWELAVALTGGLLHGVPPPPP
jgi:transposase-like protein